MEDHYEEREETSPPRESGKVSWVLEKGLRLGKKIAVSGIVISSAPLIIPLVIYSTIGFALSVPFSFYFSSYACTEKLMSTLLSTPATPDTSEYGVHYDDEGEDSRFGQVIDYEKEVEMDIGGFDQELKLAEEEGEPMGDFSGIAVKEGLEEADERLALELIERQHGIDGEETIEPIYEIRGVEIVSTVDGEYSNNYEVIIEDMDKLRVIEEEDLNDVSVQPLEEIDMKVEEEKGDNDVGGFEVKANVGIEQELVDADLLEKYSVPSRELNIAVEEEKEKGQTEPPAALNPVDEMQMVETVMRRNENNNKNVEVGTPSLMTAIVNEETQDANLVDENPLPETEMKVEGEKEVGTFSYDENGTELLLEERKEPNPIDEIKRVLIVTKGDNKIDNDGKVGETIIVTKVVCEENKDAEPESYIEEGNFAKENFKPLQEINMAGENQKGQVNIVKNVEKKEPVLDKKPVDELLGGVIVLQGDEENNNNVEDIEVKWDEENIRQVKDINLKIEEARREGNASTNKEMEPVIDKINDQKPLVRDLNEKSEKPVGEIDLKVRKESGDATLDIVEEKTEPALEHIKEPKPIDAIRGFVSAMQRDGEMNDNVEFSETVGVTKRDHEKNRDGEEAGDLTKNSIKPMGDTKLKVGERGKDNINHIGKITGPKEDIIKNKIPEKPILVEEGDKMVRRGEESSKKRKTEDKTSVIKEAPEAAAEKGNKKDGSKSFSSRLKKPIRKLRGTVGMTTKKNSNELEAATEPGTEINNGLIPKVVKPAEQVEEILKTNIESKDVDSIVEVEIPHEEAKQSADEDSNSVNNDQVHELDDRDILKRTDDSVLSDTDEGLELKKIGEDIEISNVNLAGIAHESGVDLVNDKCTADEDKSGSAMEITEGTLPLTCYTDEKSVCSVDRSTPDSPSRNSAIMPSLKVKSEYQVEEKIGALRTIVGYCIAPQATLVEELKALYIFTGVEPPVSSKDSSNLDDIEDNLRFLMSIVGVK